METCAQCGEPITEGDSSRYERLPSEDIGRTYHSQCLMEADHQRLERRLAALHALEPPLRAWVERQSAENAHCLYVAALKHFGIKPVIPD